MKKRMPSGGSQQGAMTKEMNDAIKNLLGKHVKILMKCAVKLESKGDKTENRVVVLCPCRFFCLKVPARIDFHFHYLEIQGIESKKPNQFTITAHDRSHSFMIPDPEKVENIDRMIVTLLTSVSETFPGIPLYNIIRKIDVVPAKRLQHLDFTFDGTSTGASSSSGTGSGSSSTTGTATTTPVPYPKSKSTSSLDEASVVSSLNCSGSPSIVLGGVGERSVSVLGNHGASFTSYHHMSSAMPGSVGPCGGFSTQYAWMCDLHGLPYREEVAWDVDTIYLSHDSREVSLHDFDHLEPRDLVPILSALEYNTWFKSLRASHVKLTAEAMERLLHVVRKSLTIEELHLDSIGAKTDFAQKLSTALSYNKDSQVHAIDLSHNMIEDKGAIHLSGPIGKLCRGPVRLNLSQCGLSAKGVAQLAHALAANRCAPNSLTHLNLSGNSLKDDINNLCNFLAQPNCITFLDLSGTDCTLDSVFGALLRGCTSHLAHLNLSRNNFATKKGREIPPSFKQYLTSSLALKHLSLSSCKLSLEALKHMLLGLACNESTADLELDISSNGLGQQGAHVLESLLHGIKCLSSLDISDNNLDGDLAGIVAAASKNKSLKHLNLGKNLQSTKTKHVAQVMDALVQMLQDEDCVLQSLSLADSKLKAELYNVINALGSNQCLQSIDISGNQMGDVGARLLAKALQINGKLKCITFDRNNITLVGFGDIAYGLESNSSVRYMPFPVHDSVPCMKLSAEKTEAVMKRIQDLIYRNSLPKKTSAGQQAFRLQQGFLLSSAQQTVDKLLSQTQDGVKLLRKNELNSPSSDPSHQEVITQAENLIQDSEKAKQLLLNLHELIEQKGESGKVIEKKLQQLSDDLYNMLCQHIQSNIDNVLDLTEEKCPNLMSEEGLREEIKKGCLDKSNIAPEFIRHCVMEVAGTDIVNRLNEVHLAVAAHISDRLVDRAMTSLMTCNKNLSDVSKKRSSTPDVLKTRMRSSPSDLTRELAETVSLMNEPTSHLSDQSPMATPQMHAKRKGGYVRRIRPKSVVDCVEGISADDIPDLLPSLPKTIEESISSLQDLPPISPQQLKHLGKARPKKPKTRAPTRPSLRPTAEVNEEGADLQEGLDTFFRPGSATPTPIVTPDSDECSTSLMISMASNADDSVQSTPTHSSRTFKVDDNRSDKTGSPGSFDTVSVGSKLSLESVPRSKSNDCLEKGGKLTPSSGDEKNDGQKSPVQKIGVTVGNSVLSEMKARQEKRTSVLFSPGSKDEGTTTVTVSTPSNAPITTGVSVSAAKERFNQTQKVDTSAVNRRPPPVAPKPRPWSVVGSDRKSGEFSLGSDGTSPSASAANTPDSAEVLDDKSVEGKTSPIGLNVSSSNEKASSPASNSDVFTSTVNTSGTRTISVSQGHSPVSLGTAVLPNSPSNGPLSMNVRSLSVSNGNDVPTPENNTSPLSLPSWGSSEKTGKSVRELAASLSRQHSATDAENKKKSDSLPRTPTSASVESQQQPDFSRARVSIQEWSRSQQSAPDIWKLSRSKPVTRRWEPSESKSSNGIGLRKSSVEEDVVNV